MSEKSTPLHRSTKQYQSASPEQRRARNHQSRFNKSGKAAEARRRQKPEQKQKDKEYAKRTGKSRLDYLRSFNNRFKRMKDNDPTLKDMDDIALKYLVAELMDPETPKERKDTIAFKILPFTSRAKPVAVEHSGDVTHTQLISTEATQRLEQLLFEDPSVVATIPKEDDDDGSS